MSSALFQPLSLRGLSLPNRIVVAPMCQYSADEGKATDWHLAHLTQMASSGAGLVFLEATGVELDGRITPGCLALFSDATEQALARVLESVRRMAPAHLGIQLCHAGRKGSSAAPWDGGRLLQPAEGGWLTQGPSALPHADGETPPRAMDAADLRRVREAFVDSARRAARIGLEAVELHMAHGYLLHQFLSPVANQRSDAYGGTLEARMRYPLEVFEAVRAVWPADRPCGVRISATDWVPGGWDLEQSVALAQALKRLGCDWIDCSSGGISPAQKLKPGPGYQVPFARRIRAETGLATIAVGMITDPAQAEAIVADADADLVALARGILYDPRWGWHAAAALGGQVAAPRQYWRSEPAAHRGLFSGASVNAR
jgi:2,4-dienoyl-CoA reductase-like NADH-dependent reductase (Old Yellow Enzyme family)